MVNRPLVNILTSVGPVLCGGFLVAAFSLKLLDTFLLFKVENSLLYAISLLIDLVVGSLLIVDRSKRVRLLGSITFFVYAIYRISNGSEVCDCFGRLSVFIHQYLSLSLVLACGLICLLSCLNTDVPQFHRSDSTKAGTAFKRAFSLASGLLLLLSLLKGFIGSDPILARVTDVTESDESGRILGRIELKNSSSMQFRLLGSARTRCSGALFLESPVTLEPNASVEIPCELTGLRKSFFLEGNTSIVVGINGVSKRLQFNWISLD